MIEIIAHRGLWGAALKKNSISAIKAAFKAGFGLETDVRDLNGELVISHDIPKISDEILLLEDLLELHGSMSPDLTLALNIKSDGLSLALKDKLWHLTKNYFVFDMSVPDTLSYRANGLNFYTRQSEYELNPPVYDDAIGIWMDEFHGPWITEEIVERHHRHGKSVAIVSPELHGRSFENEWKNYKRISNEMSGGKILLCTDYPIEARRYFE